MVSSVWELNAKGEKHNFFGCWRPEKLTLRLDASVMGIDLDLGIKQSRERNHTQAHNMRLMYITRAKNQREHAMAWWPAHKHALERAERRGAYPRRSGRRSAWVGGGNAKHSVGSPPPPLPVRVIFATLVNQPMDGELLCTCVRKQHQWRRSTGNKPKCLFNNANK